VQHKQPGRPYLYELDPLRVVTALCVVAVHVLTFTAYLNRSTQGLQIQNATVTTLHFTREVFMFVTALALTHVYFGRPFPLKRFWVRRGIGVLLPYCIWSVVYVWVNMPQHSLVAFIEKAAFETLTGGASYQLYYILLTLQFYVLLPFFCSSLPA